MKVYIVCKKEQWKPDSGAPIPYLTNKSGWHLTREGAEREAKNNVDHGILTLEAELELPVTTFKKEI